MISCILKTIACRLLRSLGSVGSSAWACWSKSASYSGLEYWFMLLFMICVVVYVESMNPGSMSPPQLQMNRS